MEHAALLHNSGLPCGATISHVAPRGHREWIMFRLPDGEWSPPAILERLDGNSWSGSPVEAECELRLRLNRHAGILPYPHAALISDRQVGAAESDSDFLTICAILAKSSAHVYLRDKEPNLANLRGGRALWLQLPDPEARHD